MPACSGPLAFLSTLPLKKKKHPFLSRPKIIEKLEKSRTSI
jgi:biotin operon repressor